MTSLARYTCFILAVLGLTPSCQSAPPPPGSGIKIDRDFWPIGCRYGYSDAKPVNLAFDLSHHAAVAESVLVETLQGAGYTVEVFVILTYRTEPRTDWPAAASPDVRRYSYPGTAVLLVMGTDSDGRRHAFGGVHALCKSDPGAPDSVTSVAQSLEVQTLRNAFADRGIGPYERSR